MTVTTAEPIEIRPPGSTILSLMVWFIGSCGCDQGGRSSVGCVDTTAVRRADRKPNGAGLFRFRGAGELFHLTMRLWSSCKALRSLRWEGSKLDSSGPLTDNGATPTAVSDGQKR